MKDKEYMSLKKMIFYINKALKYIEGCDFKSFSANEEKVDATVKNSLEISIIEITKLFLSRQF